MANDDPRLRAALEQNAKIGGSRTITFGKLEIVAPVAHIREAMEFLSAADRSRVMVSVNAAIARDLPAVESRRATTEVAIRCAEDITIWFANEIIECRAFLGVN